jgi:hypothetical protein
MAAPTKNSEPMITLSL